MSLSFKDRVGERTIRHQLLAEYVEMFWAYDGRLVNNYMRQSSEAFPGLGHECKRRVFGARPRFYMILSVDSFSNWIDPRFFCYMALKDVWTRVSWNTGKGDR
jgi:hypothetical protein